MSYGANAGYAINPARDFGPRFFAWLAGWGRVALPGVPGYVWVPIIGPLIGGVVGAVVYDLFIRDVLVARGAPPAPDVEARGETVEEEPAGPASDAEAGAGPSASAEEATGWTPRGTIRPPDAST
jgi:glycerol uptake facilitator protein